MATAKKPNQLSLSKKFVLMALVIAFIVIGATAYFQYSNKKTAPVTEVYRPKADTAVKPSAPTTATSPTSLPQSTAPQASKSGNITITSPTQGGTLTSGSTVTGRARAFEGSINYRLKAAASGVLAQGVFQLAGDSSQLQPYSFSLVFEKEVSGGNDQGTLSVFSISPEDGSEIDIASVNVNIK